MNSDARPHLDKLADLLAQAHAEADAAVGHLAAWQHGSALDLRDAVGELIRDTRGLRIAAGLGAPEDTER